MITLHVSPTKPNLPTPTEPNGLKTLAAARDRVREIIRSFSEETPAEDITVKLGPGMHSLDQTFVLGPEDGSDGTFQISWEGEGKGQTLLSSGVPLSDWTHCAEDPPDVPEDARGRVWVSQLAPGTKVNTLYGKNGGIPRAKGRAIQPQRFHESVSENNGRFGPDGPISCKMGSDKPEGIWLHDRFCFKEGAIRQAADLHEAEFLVIPAMQWTMNVLAPEKIDFERGVVQLKHPCTYPIGIPHCAPEGSIWLENSLSVLTPGSWVFHAKTAKLYYCPEGAEPEEELMAGRLVEFVRLEGEPGRPVKGLHFRNLTFAHSNRYAFHGLTGLGIQHDWEMHDAATCMVRMRHAEACGVADCLFTDGGSGGVRLDLACRDNRVENCEFSNLGGCGVVLCGYGLSRNYLNRNNHVLGNHLHHLGRAYWHCPGIFIWQSGENHVADNHLHDLPYTGIVCSGRTLYDRGGKGECSRTIDWNAVEAQCGKGYEHNVWYHGGLPSWWMREPLMHARDNLIEYNRIHNVMQVMGDGNGIYISGAGGGNVVRFNVVGPCPSPTMAEGIRCDDDQHHTILHGNLIYQQGGHATGITLKGVNRVTNNILAMPLNTPLRAFLSLETGPLNGSVIQRNIFLSTDPEQRFVSEMRIHGQGRQARLRDTESDRNVYWCLGDPGAGPRFLDVARSFGTDTESLAEDPGFIDPLNFDFHLKPDAAARKAGFQDLPLERMMRWQGFSARSD